MPQPNFFAACYMIFENQKGEILFQKRAGTNFRCGCYQVPAGHMEGEETMKECAIRESKEELGVDILEEDLEILHIDHRVAIDRVYFDIFLKVKKYSGELKIAEPEKCSELKFFDIKNISEDEKKLFGYDLDVIFRIINGEKFSEIK